MRPLVSHRKICAEFLFRLGFHTDIFDDVSPLRLHENLGEGEGKGFVPGGKFNFGGEGVEYIPSKKHHHPSPPPLAPPPPPPPPPPLYGAAGLEVRCASTIRKASNIVE